MLKKTHLAFLLLSVFVVAAAGAAPRLRLNIPRATAAMPNALQGSTGERLPVWIAAGTNGPVNIFIEAWNAGDGNLVLTVNGGPSDWLAPELGGMAPCSFDAARTCREIRVLFETANLPRGAYRGKVAVLDANAVDSPQRVPVTLYVGGNVPGRVDLYVGSGAANSDSIEFQTAGGPAPTLTVDPAGQYLLVSSSGQGSFKFQHTHRLTGIYGAGLPVGDQQGSVTISGSSFAEDNRVVPVTLHVTNDPIATAILSPAGSTALEFSEAQGMDAPGQALVVENRGNGSLTIAGVEVETDSGGDWLSTEDLGDGIYLVSATAAGLAPGLYTGLVRFNTNAANGPLEVPVEFEVLVAGPPEIAFDSVVNSAAFDSTKPVSPGAIVSLFGTQLAPSTAGAESKPLPRELASTKVFINGAEAPLFFVSYGQINFQIPWEAAQGIRTVQVVREGQAGNVVSADVADRSSGVFRINIGEYGAIINASQSTPGNVVFALPEGALSAPGFSSGPARPGDELVIYATGLGGVAPPVGTGEETPLAGPLSHAFDVPLVNFGGVVFGPFAIPSFVGLTPGSVGVFQVNVTVPDEAPTNPRTAITLDYSDGQRSNTVEIAVER